MFVERAIARIHVRSSWVELIIGSLITALAISLGMLAIADALGFELNPALPAAFGAVGAALFAARMRIHSEANERN